MVVRIDWINKERESKQPLGYWLLLSKFSHSLAGLFYWRTLWFGGQSPKFSGFWVVSNDSCVQAGSSATATVRAQNPKNQGNTEASNTTSLHTSGFSLAYH